MTKEPTFNLTEEEQEIEDSFNDAEYVSKPITAAEKRELTAIARNTIAKNKVLTLRISERNLMRVKAAAAREGISYQTYITALIQKHT